MKLNPTNKAIIKRLLVGRNSRPLKSIIQRVEPADLASYLVQLNPLEQKRLISALISIRRPGTVLEQIPEVQLKNILLDLNDWELERVLKYSSIGEGSFILQCVDFSRHESILKDLPADKREKLVQFLNFPKNSAGRLMNTHFFTLPSHLTTQQGLERLREKSKEESVYYIYCVSETQKLTGVVSLRDLAISPPETSIKQLEKKEVVRVGPHMPDEEVARLVSHYDLIAIPVVNKEEQILGVITVDDVLDIIEEQATADIYASAGLQESDRVYSPLSQKIRGRTPWMLLNLLLAGSASLVLYFFENILEELVILAITKNIVTSTSGNAAIQSLTVTTRGLAINDFQYISKKMALFREVLVGMTQGFITGSLAGLVIYLFKSDLNYGFLVGLVMWLSMTLTSLVACGTGFVVPILLKNMGRDPAVGSGVIVTVITDIFGFICFLGLATLVVHHAL